MAVSLNRTGPLYAGTDLTISCTVTLDQSVNNNETVSVNWSVKMGDRYTLISDVMNSENSYSSSLIISPLTFQDSDTTYTCTGTITSSVMSASDSADVTLSLGGKCFFSLYVLILHNTHPKDLPSPVVYISEPTTGVAGDEFSLTCFVTTVPHLTSSTELSIMWSGGSVDKAMVGETTSMSGNTFLKNLTFNSLNTSYGDEYICNADINIAHNMISKTGRHKRDLVVQSKKQSFYDYTLSLAFKFLVQQYKCLKIRWY